MISKRRTIGSGHVALVDPSFNVKAVIHLH